LGSQPPLLIRGPPPWRRSSATEGSQRSPLPTEAPPREPLDPRRVVVDDRDLAYFATADQHGIEVLIQVTIIEFGRRNNAPQASPDEGGRELIRVALRLLVWASSCDQVKESAELPVGVSPAGLEFGGEDVGLRAGRRLGSAPAFGEEPNAVPRARLSAMSAEQVSEALDGVSASGEAEAIALVLGVERVQHSWPVPLVSGAHGQSVGVLGEDGEDAGRLGEATEAGDHGFGVLEVHDDAVAEHAGEASLPEEVGDRVA